MTRRRLPALMYYKRGTYWRGKVSAVALLLLDWSTGGDAGRYW